MWNAVSFALMDSVNVLLIGLIVAVGVLLPRGGKYWKIMGLLVGGDWVGVFLLALATMYLFNGIEDTVRAVIDSPIFGIILIAFGILGAVMTWRGGDNTAMLEKLLPPVRKPSGKTFVAGLLLGVIQSATSAPFFGGIAVLSVGDFSVWVQYVGMFFYACLALSLPALTALGVGFVRAFPESPAGRGFEWMRNHGDAVNNGAGYVVSVILIVLGLAHL